MARARNIKPGFFKNENIVELDPWVRLLFIGLWTLADREGRLEDRPKKIKMELFPADDFDIEHGISELVRYGFALRYEVENSEYIQIVAFTKHQKPHHQEQQSVIPAPNTSHEGASNNRTNPSDSLSSDSLSSDSKSYSDFDESAAKLLFSLITERQKKFRKPNFDKWADQVRLMRERDDRSEEEIIDMIRWCQQDSFWQANILSTQKLREKFDQLQAKRMGGNGNARPNALDRQDTNLGSYIRS